jgi:hypothetical protein
MEYLVSSNLNILNQGKEPTLVIHNRNEVIDLTLGTNRIGNLIRTTNKLEKSNGHYGGGTARRSLMYQVVPDS